MSIYDLNHNDSISDDEDANSFRLNHSYESDEDQILIHQSSTAELYQRRSTNQEFRHRNTRGLISHNSEDDETDHIHDRIMSSRIREIRSHNSDSSDNEDANSLYSNSDNDFNYRLSSDLRIQQTLISYNPRLTEALRNVEAAAAGWRLRYELERLENQELQHRAEVTELRRIYELERWENQALQRRAVEAEAAEWRRRCEFERLENKELQRKAAEAKVAEWQRKYESERSTNQELQQKTAEAETTKWKQKYEAERYRSHKRKGICTASSQDLAYSVADESESTESKPKDELDQDLDDKESHDGSCIFVAAKAEIAERKREENQDLQHKAAEPEQIYELESEENQEVQQKGRIAGLYPGLFHYAFVCLMEILMMVVAYLVPNFLIGLTTGAGFIGGIIMMYSGDFRLLPHLSKIFCHYTISYMIFGYWHVNKSDLVENFGVMDWRDLTATILAIFLCSRIIFYVVVTLKELILKSIRAKFYFNVQFSRR